VQRPLLQASPDEQVLPAQQMSPSPPQLRQTPLVLQARPSSQVWFGQQRWPAAPQGVRQIPLALQTSPTLQLFTGQHGCPAAPQGTGVARWIIDSAPTAVMKSGSEPVSQGTGAVCATASEANRQPARAVMIRRRRQAESSVIERMKTLLLRAGAPAE